MIAIASKLKRKLLSDDTDERCGLVLKSGRIIEVENKHPHPHAAFMISVKHLQKYKKSVVATWHTHPKSTAALSQDDYLGFSAWHHLTHYIVGTDGVQAYKSDPEGVIEPVPCK
jgi:proteasome lid subunit RPN8/RPN11